MRIGLYAATCSLLAYYGSAVRLDNFDNMITYMEPGVCLDYELAETDTLADLAKSKAGGKGKVAAAKAKLKAKKDKKKLLEAKKKGTSANGAAKGTADAACTHQAVEEIKAVTQVAVDQIKVAAAAR